MKDLSQKVLYIYFNFNILHFINTFDLFHQNLVMTFHVSIWQLFLQSIDQIY